MSAHSMYDGGIHLAYFDPAIGHVPNPGMGLQAYVVSDHMHHAFTSARWRASERQDPNEPLPRPVLERMLELPYVDNLYFRTDWNRVQSRPGRLDLPPEWDWMLEAAHERGKSWSFRVMNASRHSATPTSVPAFLQDELPVLRYRNEYEFGPPWRSYPAYTAAYLARWRELMELFAERYDDDPALEFVDVSGFGIWGEGHHYGIHEEDGPILNLEPDGADEAVRVLLQDHLGTFRSTPVAMTLHLLDFAAGAEALANPDVWVRRDSFQPFTSVTEYRAMADRVPGRSTIWETIVPAEREQRPPLFSLERLPQRYLDFTAHYAAVGFNPWDVIQAHQSDVALYEALAQRIGYRLRPMIVWRRPTAQGQELVVALTNDGTADVPGTLTLTCAYPGGEQESLTLPAGRPVPGDRAVHSLPVPAAYHDRGAEVEVRMTAQLTIRGKTRPVRWAVRQLDSDPFVLRLPLLVPPAGDPFTTRLPPYEPSF